MRRRTKKIEIISTKSKLFFLHFFPRTPTLQNVSLQMNLTVIGTTGMDPRRHAFAPWSSDLDSFVSHSTWRAKTCCSWVASARRTRGCCRHTVRFELEYSVYDCIHMNTRCSFNLDFKVVRFCFFRNHVSQHYRAVFTLNKLSSLIQPTTVALPPFDIIRTRCLAMLCFLYVESTGIYNVYVVGTCTTQAYGHCTNCRRN